MPLSLTEILRKAQRVDIEGIPSVAIVKDSVRKQRNVLLTTTKTRPAPGEAKRYHYHNQRVYPVDRKYTGNLASCPAVKVSCTCERFTYVWEVALWKQGAADILYSNGEMPTQTNPRMIPGCCKHLIKIIKYIHENSL